ncbi:MAG: enoyl-CoA hydratase/isomerase family protein [Halobacteriovoraceae bacterium]|nr:enoyl-CoA hydratase/isomerase family protein [Halobacteriovoraceae bacterium]
MGQLFSYHTIFTQLIKDSRTLVVTLNRPEIENAMTIETLFELESIISWASSKIEIHSILINSSAPLFSIGISQSDLKKYNLDKVMKVRKKLWDVQKLMLSIPQITVIDFAEGANNLSLEFGFAADLRLASLTSQFKFNNLELGIPYLHPSLLSRRVLGFSEQKNWLFYTKNLDISRMLRSGFLFDAYDSSNREDTLKKLLANIKKQSPISRIQSKLALNQQSIEDVEDSIEEENKIIQAALSVKDWKNDDHLPAREVKKAMRMTLLKGGKSPEI